MALRAGRRRRPHSARDPTRLRTGQLLHWTERQGWYYALIGMSPQDVLLYTVLLPFRTFFPPPQNVAEVAEQLVRTMRVPDVEYRTEWDGAGGVRALPATSAAPSSASPLPAAKEKASSPKRHRAGLPTHWIESEFAALRYFALNGTDHRTHDEQNAAIAADIR
ncbi:DUF6292 family protein [Streptomyces chartreusis]